MYIGKYDVIVIGLGHAGCEAFYALSRMGMKTLGVTVNIDNIAQMSCNPAIGGLAKSQIVFELDAFGGVMPKIADMTAIQTRTLNLSKGPAVWSLRTQNDKWLYKNKMRLFLEKCPNAEIKQGIVEKINFEGGRIRGVSFHNGAEFECGAVVIATGTFLNGVIHIGDTSMPGGRLGDIPSVKLSECLNSLGFRMGRLKTGTPPRIDRRTVDLDALSPESSDAARRYFSKSSKEKNIKNIDEKCYLVRTGEKTHEFIRNNLKYSALYSGKISGTGPRYCPSIEDKIVRFKDKESHRLFLEPEGIDTYETYLQGFSMSLPEHIQLGALRTLKGFEKAEIVRPAYAIEYDYVHPVELFGNLMTKKIEGLFLAGQINGTSGYEEAAGQGLIAGINAALYMMKRPPLILGRTESYIGILIDDLVTKDTDEPYRMFTSRAEFRLNLREDNADVRLSKYAFDLGLIDSSEMAAVEEKERRAESFAEKMKNYFIMPSEEFNLKLAGYGSQAINSRIDLYRLLKRPEIKINYMIDELKKLDDKLDETDAGFLTYLETTAKYDGYIKKQNYMIERVKKYDEMPIPADFNYDAVASVSTEGKMKLKKHAPMTIGAAARISGVSMSDVMSLFMYLSYRDRETKKVI
ncbi:MAG TPA: tRNA uridine-5-carboxymethylaminomethyl(34) synthesis enzyme MnmG [Candidatus Wallbacteria bacterium]|nr:tRNA uridine-5-carboxymethylaminomethyl(34) synthesis enzyme MnmG [Candidatus Wallbacteria bacterium]